MRFLPYLLPFFILVNGAVASSASAQSDEPPLAISLESHYTLGSGDRIQITVFGVDLLSGEFPIDGGGNISYPLLGEIKVGGLTLRELENTLLEKLRDGYLVNPSISLEVLNYRPFYILGEVRNPGKYEFVSGISIYNAVAMAGGYTHRARENRARVTRSNPEETLENVDHSTLVMPGDIIHIRERFF